MKRIPVAGPWITEHEVSRVAEAVRTAWYEHANDFHERFETGFARYLGVRHAVALPSCTSAIHLALLALNVGPGDEVIVPESTWIASAAPISYVGATPVFADVDPRTWCLDVDSFRSAITSRTRAVIPVDLYGGMPALDEILALARRYDIAVIEDAAEALGAEYRRRKAGSWGDIGTFSFHGSKTLTTGEGGMLVANDADLHARILVLRDHGRRPGDRYFFNQEVGWKYKMSAMQAALGLAQLERFEEILQRKRLIFRWYLEELGHVPGLVLNAEPPDVKNAYWMVTALFDARFGFGKERLMTALAEQQIDSRPFFHPLSSLPAYADCPGVLSARERNRVAYDIGARGVNLPSALSLTREQVAYVGRVVRALCGAEPLRRSA
ncbi:MAG TPA: DegT/DnrJ/EryC1/StrS family aminotransferase [Gemmatales bacterium]|nr:DegT/DnrJ/EryC1/StrS family aminotransferase [Gemmatales bacterium]